MRKYKLTYRQRFNLFRLHLWLAYGTAKQMARAFGDLLSGVWL